MPATTQAPPAAATIPSIDFAGYLLGSAPQRAAACREIEGACRRYGFFYLDAHGIDPSLIGNGFDAAREFFSLPLEERLACKVAKGQRNRGYQPMFETQKLGLPPDVKHSFDMGFPLDAAALAELESLPFYSDNAWPADPGFRWRIENLYHAKLACGHHVLRAMAEILGLDRNLFVSRCRRPFTNMRLVHYPPQPGAEDQGIGAHAHTDKGLITLLLNDTNGGLQVQDTDGGWIDVPPRPGALIVNVGDLLTRWTNGRFRSALHRVVNASGNERYSIAQFHHLDYFTVVDPAEIPGGGETVYPPITAGEFVGAGFRRDRKSWREETTEAAA